MRQAAVARRAVGQRAGVLLRVLDELGHGAARYLGRVGDQDQRIGDEQRDGREIAPAVVGQFRVGVLRDDEGRGGEQHRVAVGRGLGDDVGADGRGRAGLVVHDHRLAPARGQLLGHHAGHHVRLAAWRERHDESHGLAREGRLGVHRRGGQRERGAQQAHGAGEGFHESPRGPRAVQQGGAERRDGRLVWVSGQANRTRCGCQRGCATRSAEASHHGDSRGRRGRSTLAAHCRPCRSSRSARPACTRASRGQEFHTTP